MNGIIATLTTITFLSSSCDFFFSRVLIYKQAKTCFENFPPPPFTFRKRIQWGLVTTNTMLHYYSNLSIFISYRKVPICLPAEVNLFSFVTHVKVRLIGLPTEVNQPINFIRHRIELKFEEKKLGRDFIFEFLFCQLGTSRSIEQEGRYE